MAQLYPEWEAAIDNRADVMIRAYKVTLQSSSDTVTVPDLAHRNTPANSVAELDATDPANDTGVTVTASGANTITITGGSSGGTVVFVTRHDARTMVNHDEGSG